MCKGIVNYFSEESYAIQKVFEISFYLHDSLIIWSSV